MSLQRLDPAALCAGVPEQYLPDESKRLSGTPLQRLWPLRQDASGQFFTGIWESAPGKWEIRYTEEEYCEILSGCSVITDAAGVAATVSAGDRFVIPAGFCGSWEVLETTRKIYVIFESNGAAAGGQPRLDPS